MHLYRSIPKQTSASKPIDVIADGSFSDSMNGSTIFIKANVTLTLDVSLLSEDFRCRILCFTSGTLSIKPIGDTDLQAPEGIFIRPNELTDFYRDGATNTCILGRNRPVENTGWIKIFSDNHWDNKVEQNFDFNPHVIRVMRGAELLLETSVPRVGGQGWLYVDNPNKDMLDVYTSNNQLINDVYNQNVKILYAENFDFSLYTGDNVNFSGIQKIIGIDSLISVPNLSLTLSNASVALDINNQYVLDNFNGRVLDLSGKTDHYFAEYSVVNRPNLEHLKFINITNVGLHLIVNNNPVLGYLDTYQNTSSALLNTVDLDFSTCPLLAYVKLRNAQETTSPDKNIDQVFIDLDTNGLSNGTAWFSSDFVTTAASDAARANLVAKAWVIKRDNNGTIIE